LICEINSFTFASSSGWFLSTPKAYSSWEIIPRYQRDVSGIEEKVIALYARGMSTRDISEQIEELYGFSLSTEMVSKITDRIAPEIKEWQQRPLEPIYTFVFIDAIHYKVRDEGRIVNRAAYVVVGVTVEGSKDIWGFG